jgi:hypothetical protein
MRPTENTTLPQLASAQLSLFHLWQLENEEMKGFLNTIAPWMVDASDGFCAIYKGVNKWKKDGNNKMLIPLKAIYTEFFHCTFANAVYALLRNWQLGAWLPITVGDNAATLKVSHTVGDRQVFQKTSAPLSWTYLILPSLILAGFFLRDSALKLKGTQVWEFFWLQFWILYYFNVSYA